MTSNDTVVFARQLTYRSGTNTLGIIFFCLTFGTVLGSFGAKAKPVIDFFNVIDEVILSMVYGIMWLDKNGQCCWTNSYIIIFSDLQDFSHRNKQCYLRQNPERRPPWRNHVSTLSLHRDRNVRNLPLPVHDPSTHLSDFREEEPVQVLVGSLPSLDDSLCDGINVS
jgi:hypothetical protein